MKINPIQQNNISHKAYFKPNNNLKKVFGGQTLIRNCDESLLKNFRSMPNHELEIIDIINHDKDLAYGAYTCVVFNNTTKKAVNLFFSRTSSRIDAVLERLSDISLPIIQQFYEKNYTNIDDYMNLTKPRQRREI